MYAFNSPPNLFCKKHVWKGRCSSSSGYFAATILMHTSSGQHSSPELKKSSASTGGFQATSSLLSRGTNTIGIIGGVSVFSTLIFLEKLVWWSSRHGNECVPFIVSSGHDISRDFPFCNQISPVYEGRNRPDPSANSKVIIENLRRKREILEISGARCIVMPCHLSHFWYHEISKGCSLPFLHLGDCVARELKAANLKPFEAGGKVRIGLISTYAILNAGFYQDKLQSQGFEVLLPDKLTTEHIVLPAITALNRKDIEGGQNLLRIAINILLMRGVNMVVIASDRLQGLLPSDDPLMKKCIDPNEALARFTIRWAQSVENSAQIISKQIEY